MILIPDVKNKKIGVFGLGLSGMATAEALLRSGAHVYTWDENKTAREKTLSTEYRAEHPKQWPWQEMAFVVISPGVPLTHPKPHAIVRKARAENIPVIGDVELFARAINSIPAPERPHVIAITGSNGKSTTTALIGHILRHAGEDVCVGGNIGDPVLSLDAPSAGMTYVLELSSFQLDLTYSLHANAAIFLNLSPDHIERHGTVAGYIAAKTRIFFNQESDDLAVIDVDNPAMEGVVAELKSGHKARFAPISVKSTLSEGAFVRGGKLFHNLQGKTLRAGDISDAPALRGDHNMQNAAAALAACVDRGVSSVIAVKAMHSFEALPHRLETVAKIGKVSLVNDSKATNASAAARALSAYDNIYWIAGGKPKDGGVAELTGLMDRVRRVYLIGEAAAQFSEQLRESVNCIVCDGLEDAVSKANADAQASDWDNAVVLLSPACASYDQFDNFEQRGEAFRKFARALPSQNGAAA